MDGSAVQLGTCTLYHGDALGILPTLAENSLDAVITDPPYGLAFMGAEFDTLGDGAAQQAWHRRWAEAVYRVMKPGAFLVAFGGTRTHHRLMCALEDAGFELRDTLMYIYGSGWPKGGDVSKAIDKAAGVERKVIGEGPFAGRNPRSAHARQGLTFADDAYVRPAGQTITAPATDAAQQWQGFASSLKPAYEPIILARKPLQGTVVENILRWGCGALNIDACRIVTGDDTTTRHSSSSYMTGHIGEVQPKQAPYTTGSSQGRWPANIVLDDSAEVWAGFPQTTGRPGGASTKTYNVWFAGKAHPGFHDEGSAARYFYCAKASPSDRGEGNTHPTTKPTSLMRWLLRLAVPPGGVCLDLFAGSGTTGVAAIEEGVRCLLIEREPAYFDIMRRRLEAASRQPDLFRAPATVAPSVPNPQPSLFGEE